MTNERLNELYNSHKANCCKCGCELSTENGGLGHYFVLDKKGNFYCSNCDNEFEDYDERIYEPDLCDCFDEEGN